MLRGARLALLGSALTLILLTTVAKAARWALLLRPCQLQGTPSRICRVLLIGQMANGFLPRLGDVLRAVLLGPGARGGVPAVFGTILVEKVLDSVLGLTLLVGLGLWTPLPTWIRGSILGLALLTGSLLFLLAVAFLALNGPGRFRTPPWWRCWRQRWRLLSDRFPWDLGERTERLVAAFIQGMGLFQVPADAALALGLSVIIWVLSALTNIVTLEALEIEAPSWTAWLVVVAGYAATFLPTVPAQLGVFEYSAVLSLTAGGVAPEPALAFALILHLLVQLPPAILGPLSAFAEGLDWGRLGAARRAYLEPDDAHR